jgi:uncharacterized protein (DUF2461 family)
MRTVAARFHGWPEDAYAVLLALEGDPSRETRESVRRRREMHVRQPMIDLLNDLADADPWYEDFAVWGYATTPYWWQNQSAIVRAARNIGFGFRFSLEGLRIGASWWYGVPEQIPLFRAAVAAEESGRALADLVSSLAADGHEISGNQMKRMPRGYLTDHPRADLLKHRSLGVARELEPDGVRDVEPVYRACERLRPLVDWFTDYVAVSSAG